MTKPKIDLIFNGTEFNTDFLHNGKGECPYCFLNFMHQHCTGYKLKKFIKINLPKEPTFEEKFEKEFCDRNIINVLCWKFKREEDVPSPRDILKFVKDNLDI